MLNIVKYGENMQKIDIFNKIKMFFQNTYSKNKKLLFLTVAILIIIFVVFVSSLFSSKKQNTELQQSQDVMLSDYTNSLESKLESMLLKIKTISNVDVLVMVDSTPKVNYLTETEETEVTNSVGSTKTTTSKVVYEKNGSTTKPIIVFTQVPKVVGVLIVTNKIDASTKLSIINSISVVLNVDASCITILQER